MEGRQYDNTEEKARIDKLIAHQMNFLNLDITTEDRMDMMAGLPELDKDKLVQLESSLLLSTHEDYDTDRDGYFTEDKRFIASFTDNEIQAFKDLQNAIRNINTENPKIH